MRPIRTGCAALLGAAALTCATPAAPAAAYTPPDPAGFGVRVMSAGDAGDTATVEGAGDEVGSERDAVGTERAGGGEISATSRPDPRRSSRPGAQEIRGVKAGEGGASAGGFDLAHLGLGAALVAGGLTVAHRLSRRREEDGAG